MQDIFNILLCNNTNIPNGDLTENIPNRVYYSQGEQGTAELGAKTVLKQTDELCF